MNIKIAWRNIWRNKKRTLITISSVVLAVILAVFMRSLQEGSYAVIIKNSVGQYTGYVQVHQKDYWDDKTLDNGIEINDTLLQTIQSVNKVTGYSLRLEGFSLVSYKKNTKGAMIMGIEPIKENKMLNIKSKLIEGEYFSEKDSGLIIGSKLAKYLNADINDTLVLIGQGHWGQSAIGAFKIKGIVKMPSPTLDRQVIFMPLALAQKYFSFENGVTSIIVQFADNSLTETITNELNAKLDTSIYRAMTWQEMSPVIAQQIQSDRSSGIMMLGILYMIIAFGIFGTVLMMTEERKKEFAIMIAIGTQKSKLIIISIYEALFINLIGVFTGIILAFPLVYYFLINPITMTGKMAESMESIGYEPIMPTLIDINIFLHQTYTILIITGIAALYPLFSIWRMKLIKSLRR